MPSRSSATTQGRSKPRMRLFTSTMKVFLAWNSETSSGAASPPRITPSTCLLWALAAICRQSTAVETISCKFSAFARRMMPSQIPA